MSRARSVVRGFATDLAGQVILTTASFALAPLILKCTSTTQYGFWLSAVSVLSYIGLVDIGLGMAFTQAVAARAGKVDDDNLNRLISTGFVAFLGTGGVIGALGLGISTWIPGWFHIPITEAATVISAYRVVVIATAIAIPCSIFNGIVCGFQRMATDNILRTTVAVFAVGLSVLLLWLNFGLMALALSALFTTLGTAVLGAFYAFRCHPALRVSFAFFSRQYFREMLSFGGYFQLGKVANTVATNSDNIVISTALGAGYVTPYSFTAKLATLFSFTLASKLPIAAFPAMAQMFANGEMDELRSATLRLSGYATRLAVLGASVFLAVNEQFVTLWVGHSQFAGYTLCAVFCYWVLQDTLYRGTTSIVFASGKLKLWAWASLGEALINIISSLILVRSFGIVGVALGTSIGKTLTTAWVVPVLICRQVKMGFCHYAWQGVARPALASAATPIIAAILASLLPLELGWFRPILVGAGALFASVLPFEGLTFIKAPSASWGKIRALAK